MWDDFIPPTHFQCPRRGRAIVQLNEDPIEYEKRTGQFVQRRENPALNREWRDLTYLHTRQKISGNQNTQETVVIVPEVIHQNTSI